MIINLNNLKGGDLSLDLFITKDIPPIRALIPQGGSVDVGEQVSLEQLALSQDLQTLIANGDISMTVQSESTDIEEALHKLVLTVAQVTAASESIPLGLAPKSGTIKAAKAASIAVAAATEDMSIDILKNGATILTAAIVIDDSVAARTVVAGVLDSAEVEVAEGDFLEAVLTYTAGTPTPIVGTIVELEIIPS